MTTIYVTMEGGICQGVSSDDPAQVGLNYVVIDYDTEGADEVEQVRQGDGTISEAVIGGGEIDAIGVEILQGEAK